MAAEHEKPLTPEIIDQVSDWLAEAAISRARYIIAEKRKRQEKDCDKKHTVLEKSDVKKYEDEI